MKKMRQILRCAAITALLTATAHAAYDPTIRCNNIHSADLQALTDAANTVGLKVDDATANNGNPAVVLWEAKQSNEITPARIKELAEYVRQGGRLIITMDSSPGTSAFRMAELSPTTAWRSLIQTEYRGGAYPATASGEWDSTMFPQPPATPLSVPFYFPLRTFDVVETGMQRYERFTHPQLFGKGEEDIPAGTPAYTRPLLNRDWQTRIRSNDVGNSALLITGRFGAGRVAVFASSARNANADVWNPLLKWLEADHPADPIVAEPPKVSFSSHVDAQHHSLIVDLSNETADLQSVEVIGRVLTWEHALIGDDSQTVEIPANGKTSVALALPSPGAKQVEALDFRDAFIVRLGLIANQGSTLVAEKETPVDFTPSAKVCVSLDNLRHRQNPFNDAAGEKGESSMMGSRMGEPVTAYAYAPGQDVNVTATLSNGLINLAPMATVTDETQMNNPSVVALNDQVQPATPAPLDRITAYGVWEGMAKADNSLLFTFPHPVHVADLVVTSGATGTREEVHQPGEVIVEADGKQVADVTDFEAKLTEQACAVHIPITPVDATTIRIKLPWTNTLANGHGRSAPWIGEIEIHGYDGAAPQPVQGKLTLTMSEPATNSQHVLAEQDVQLKPGEENPVAIKIPSSDITTDGSAARFFRVDAKLALSDGQSSTSSSTFMVVQPVNPLRPIGDVHPADAPSLNFVVTRGFRNGEPIGAGTRNATGAWDSPDDLVYAYEHGLKQTGPSTHGTVKKMFVTENDFGHYCAPWSIFPNGQIYFDVAAPNFVEMEKKQRGWAESKVAQLGFGDRWDTGPAASLLYSWPEIVAFDEYLHSQNLGGLTGKTREELCQDIQAHFDSRFSAWHMERYAECVKAMSDAFAAEGKKLIFSGQGTPLVPDQYQEQIASTIQGMSDDTTWGMSMEDVPQTTGRQMATLAFNPVWGFDEVFVWGFDSAVLNNAHWHTAVGTTESSRRHYADPGWRGMVNPHGKYRLADTFGFGMNAGVSYCMNLNDWQEMWRMQERLSLITPDAPLGAGMIVANANWNDPAHATFSGGGMGGSPADSIIGGISKAFGTLCDLRVPVSFTSNVMSMGNWSANTPLVILDMKDLSEGEIKVLQGLHQRGVHLIGFTGGQAIQPAVATLFGATPQGDAAEAKVAGTVGGKAVVVTDTTMLINASATTTTANDLEPIADAMRNTLACDVKFPEGTAGYGFNRGKQKFIVVEDWKEQGRDLTVRLRATTGAASASAVNVNDHTAVDVKRDGEDWVLSFPTRPGDGTLLCVEEK
jgi:hypothetical protein